MKEILILYNDVCGML